MRAYMSSVIWALGPVNRPRAATSRSGAACALRPGTAVPRSLMMLLGRRTVRCRQADCEVVGRLNCLPRRVTSSGVPDTSRRLVAQRGRTPQSAACGLSEIDPGRLGARVEGIQPLQGTPVAEPVVFQVSRDGDRAEQQFADAERAPTDVVHQG